MTAWEWGVKKEKGASPSPLGGYGVFAGWIWDMA